MRYLNSQIIKINGIPKTVEVFLCEDSSEKTYLAKVGDYEMTFRESWYDYYPNDTYNEDNAVSRIALEMQNHLEEYYYVHGTTPVNKNKFNIYQN